MYFIFLPVVQSTTQFQCDSPEGNMLCLPSYIPNRPMEKAVGVTFDLEKMDEINSEILRGYLWASLCP